MSMIEIHGATVKAEMAMARLRRSTRAASSEARVFIHLELPGLPPTLNAARRMHWAARRRREAEVRHGWWVAYHQQRKPGWDAQLSRARVSMTFRLPKRRQRDEDNYIGGPGKLLLDFLRWPCAVLVDDSAEHVKLGDVEFERGEEGVTVYIEPLP